MTPTDHLPAAMELESTWRFPQAKLKNQGKDQGTGNRRVRVLDAGPFAPASYARERSSEHLEHAHYRVPDKTF